MTKIGNVSTGTSNTNNVNEEIIKETYENIENLKESWKEKLADAKELDLFFTTGKLFTNANRDYLKSFVANGGTIRYLCGNPGSDFLEDIAEIESERRGNRDSIHEEYQDVLIILREVLNEAKSESEESGSNPGKIYVGNCDSLFRSSILMVKKDNENFWGWVKPTFPPKKSREILIAYEIGRDNSDDLNKLSKDAKEYFDEVWKFANKRGNIVEVSTDMDAKKIASTKLKTNRRKVEELQNKLNRKNRIFIIWLVSVIAAGVTFFVSFMLKANIAQIVSMAFSVFSSVICIILFYFPELNLRNDKK